MWVIDQAFLVTSHEGCEQSLAHFQPFQVITATSRGGTLGGWVAAESWLGTFKESRDVSSEAYSASR